MVCFLMDNKIGLLIIVANWISMKSHATIIKHLEEKLYIKTNQFEYFIITQAVEGEFYKLIIYLQIILGLEV